MNDERDIFKDVDSAVLDGGKAKSDVSMEIDGEDNGYRNNATTVPVESRVSFARPSAQLDRNDGSTGTSCRKRKFLDASLMGHEEQLPQSQGVSKKTKLDAARREQLPMRSVIGKPPGGDWSLLPVRHTFPYVSPVGTLASLEANMIWQVSRRRFWPSMPAPLRDKTELDMWRLTCSRSCQRCGKRESPEKHDRKQPHDAEHAVPGPNGVAVIWAFAMRFCGTCLLKESVKEIDLLPSSSIPASIGSALPFVFLTPELNILTAISMQRSQKPDNPELAKVFLSSDVEDLQREFIKAKDMGPGTLEEWLKGLENRGCRRSQDAWKWESWESSGGLERIRGLLHPGYRDPTRSCHSPAAASTTLPDASAPSQSENPSVPSVRQERTKPEAEVLKAARKAEIEKRALLLSPSLTPAVLGQMSSFQAATQIATPLDDDAWDILKPRLLMQRLRAKHREQDETLHDELATDRGRRRVETTLATTKEARDLVDKEWEEVQAPLRARIAGYADEAIRHSLERVKKLNKENCGRFAADVLVHVRKRFYAGVAKDAAASKAAGREAIVDPPEGPFTQKLTLENMKWIYDTKIKSHTEQLRRDIFFCNGREGNAKPFGFEGVIQHYAAKHTTALSLGNIVVYWRAEWPEHPPFNPEARVTKPPRANGKGSMPLPSANDAGVPFHQALLYNPLTQPHGTATYDSEQYPQQPQPLYHDPNSFQQPPAAYPATYLQTEPYMPHHLPHQAPGLCPPPGPDAAGQGPNFISPAPMVPPQLEHHSHDYGTYPLSGLAAYPHQSYSSHPHAYPTQLEEVARTSREIWNTLGSIRHLPGSVRIFTTIHHLVKRFRSRFSASPPLSLFIDGLSNHKDMRPVRNVSSLTCKACHAGLGNAASVRDDRETFSFPQLANHFQSKHVEAMQQTTPHLPPLDWVTDMILLPDATVVSNFIANFRSSTSPDSQKYYLLSDALPEAFQPLPTLDSTLTSASYYQQPARQVQQYPQPIANFSGSHPANLAGSNERSYAQPAANGPVPRQAAQNTYPSSTNPSVYPYHGNPPDTEPTPTYETSWQRGNGHAIYPALSDRSGSGASGHEGKWWRDINNHSSEGLRPTRDAEARRVQEEGDDRYKTSRHKHPASSEMPRWAEQEAEAKRAREETWHQEHRTREIWTADKLEVAHVYTSSAGPESQTGWRTERMVNPLYARGQTATGAGLGSTNPASEMHLVRPSSAADQCLGHVQAQRFGLNREPASLPEETRYVTLHSAAHDVDRTLPTSPAPDGRYWESGQRQAYQDLPGQTPDLLPPEPAYYKHFLPPSREEPRQERLRSGGPDGRDCEPAFRHAAERFYEPPSRGPSRMNEQSRSQPPVLEAAPYSRPRHRQSENFPDDARPLSHAPERMMYEQTYEIVLVIDEQGEYLIRRPVRLEAEPYSYAAYQHQHQHQHQLAQRGQPPPPVAYEAPVPILRAASHRSERLQPPLWDSRQASSIPLAPVTDAGLAYEEYDPRFPVASTSGTNRPAL